MRVRSSSRRSLATSAAWSGRRCDRACRDRPRECSWLRTRGRAIDTSKHVFTLHGVDEQDYSVVHRNFRCADRETFFGKLPSTEVVMGACGGAHHWGRLLARLGHTVRLMPAQYVKPFVKRAKNDRADAEAINDAASRPGMASVPVKSAERQAALIILRHREMLVGQRTQLINALRGHATEFGVTAGKSTAHVQSLLHRLGWTGWPPKRRSQRRHGRCLRASASRSRSLTTRLANSMPSCPPSTRPTRSATCWLRCRHWPGHRHHPGTRHRHPGLRLRAALRSVAWAYAEGAFHGGQAALGPDQQGRQ